MTFDEGAQIDSSHVRRRGRGVAVGAGVGGVGLIGVLLLILGPMLGVDLSGLVGNQGGGTVTTGGDDQALAECASGADANSSVDCLIAGTANSLDTYWSKELPRNGLDYRSTSVVLFTGQTQTGCGGATSAVGPFYCPSDETIYLDTDFFEELRTQFGTSGGPLAQMYVVAHEWGHHIQNIASIMDGLDLRTSGPGSDGVRLELQADCFAGSWVGAAPRFWMPTASPSCSR